jgi:serine/threonine protein kinase
MKIDFISSDGIHKAEKDALEQIRKVFNQSTFSQSWHGYAGFELIDRTQGDREIDLILVTHDRLLLIELKNWHGVITRMGDHWLLNNNDMGRSPVMVTTLKAKILNGKMKTRLPEPARSVRNDYRVVLCGEEDIRRLPQDEKDYILRLDDFLKISKEGSYVKHFGPKKPLRATDHIPVFSSFFRGPEFKPTGFSFNNFQIDGEAIFAHPDGVYKEYRALKQDDRRLQALLRRWDFSSLAGRADTKDERSRIGLREQRVLSYVQENNEELYASLFQPLSFPTRDNVDTDFCELYRLPPRQSRLSAFVNRYRDVLTPDERLVLAKIFISHFADLHDLGVAHRDIGDHSIWLERPSKVSISGFVAAYFPEVGTVGGLQNVIRAGAVVLPEDSEDIGAGTPTDAFRRDVYLLGVAAHHLLFLRPPSLAEGLNIYIWDTPSEDPYHGLYNTWFEKALDLVPNDRYANAREMLNALNVLRTPESTRPQMDMRDFQSYESDLIPMVVYPLEENLRQGRTHVYRSSIGDRKVCVKIWYQARPDPKRPADNHRLLDFLNDTRLIKAQPCQSVPEILDFGISQAGTFVVTEWVEGPTLDKHQAGKAIETLQLCKSLVDAVVQLHSLQLAHGDLTPEHIAICNGRPRFIDMVDFFPDGGLQAHNLAYGPPESEGATAEERDCYATAKICSELLTLSTKDPAVDMERVFVELAACLTRDLDVYRLDRVQAELERVLAPPPPPLPVFSVRLRGLQGAFIVPSDNGLYHIGVVNDSLRPDNILLKFTGIRLQVLVSVNKHTRQPSWAKQSEVPHSQFVRQANRAVAQLPGIIELTPAASNDGSSLVTAALAIPSVLDIFEELSGTQPTPETIPDEVNSEASSPSTRDIWRSILRAEETVLPEVEITGIPAWDPDTANRLHVLYSKEGQPIDYPVEDQIKVVEETDGEFLTVGDLNTKDTSTDVLVIDRVDGRFGRLHIGDKLKLQSTRDRASIQKRKAATLRISEQQSVIPNLVEYFDPALSPQPIRFDDEPTDADFEVYDVYSNGQLTFSLNAQQREAFRTLWSSGPVSLLQGPPGTGKTAFIASFIHYALKNGAKQILLASQSHEAVNNATEKVLELSERTATPIGLVRFGAEGFISDPLLPFHVNAILHEYRELFRAEMRERLSGLAPNLGLPRGYVEEWWSLQVNLGALLRETRRLQERIALASDGAATSRLQEWERKLEKRKERFLQIVASQFDIREGDPADIMVGLENTLAKRYGVDSPDAMSRLNRLGLISQEWIDRLATLRANFEEFLAKTRSLVCGTCVGLGRAEFGIVTNKYDWVIIDEAARATPGELAVAMQTARRVLLVGDHRQLPPLYTQEVSNQISADFPGANPSALTRSDFERAFESGKVVGATLRTQYRMAPPIGDLVSECFYPSPLNAGRGPAKEIYRQLPTGAKATVNWIDTTKAGRTSWDRPRPNHGSDNLYECRVILSLLRSIASNTDLLQSLIADIKGDDKLIGIICAYREQKSTLQRLLSEQEWAVGFSDLVKIDTVDSYQGKENRIIIVSLTRNNDKYRQGFLSSPERINVSVSRAMERLVIVGASRMWTEANRSSPMAKVLSFIQKRIDHVDFSIVESSDLLGGGK